MAYFVVYNITSCKCSHSVNIELCDSEMSLVHQSLFYLNFLFAVELYICILF
jgi:hypothetical protein